MKLELDWNIGSVVALFLLFTTTATTCVYGRDHDSNPDKTRNRPPSSPAPRTTASPSAYIEKTPAPVFKTPNPRRAPSTTRPRGSTLPPTPSGPPTCLQTATSQECPFSSCCNQFMVTVSQTQSISQPVDASCLRNAPAVTVHTCNLGSIQANFFLISLVNTCQVQVQTSFGVHLYVLEAPDTENQCPGTDCATLYPGFNQGDSFLAFPGTGGAKYSIIVVPDNVATATSYTLVVGVSCNP